MENSDQEFLYNSNDQLDVDKPRIIHNGPHVARAVNMGEGTAVILVQEDGQYEDDDLMDGVKGSFGRTSGPKPSDQEKRLKREIANSNERRRMQSINAGFSSLRSLLPHHEGEKLSKAAILQQTADYIYCLEQEKTRLLSQNCQLKRLLGQTQHMVETDETDSAPPPKRRVIDAGNKVMLEDEMEELMEMTSKYERERRTRMALEEKVRTLESQLFPSNRRVIHRYSTEDHASEYTLESVVPGQTVLAATAKKPPTGLVTVQATPTGTRVAPVSSAGGLGEAILLQADRLPSIIQCATIKSETSAGRAEAGRVEVERLPGLEVTGTGAAVLESGGVVMTSAGGGQTVHAHHGQTAHQGTALEIASVQDPETGATRQYIVTQVCDNTSKQNLETIVEAIRHLEGDHLFSEETGPHQVVKEEVVESCIIDDVVEVPISSLAGITLPSAGGPVTFQPISSITSHQVPVSVNSLAASLVSNLQQPLPQVSMSLAQGSSVVVSASSGSGPLLPSSQPVSVLSSLPLELTAIGPPQTSPVNLELQQQQEDECMMASPDHSSMGDPNCLGDGGSSIGCGGAGNGVRSTAVTPGNSPPGVRVDPEMLEIMGQDDVGCSDDLGDGSGSQGGPSGDGRLSHQPSPPQSSPVNLAQHTPNSKHFSGQLGCSTSSPTDSDMDTLSSSHE